MFSNDFHFNGLLQDLFSGNPTSTRLYVNGRVVTNVFCTQILIFLFSDLYDDDSKLSKTEGKFMDIFLWMSSLKKY